METLAGGCDCGVVRYAVADAFEYASNCHCSLLFSVVRGGAYVHVAMGSHRDAPSIRPQNHIFAASKAPWFEITDDLPQFEGYPE